jgi:hypothetical protein
LASREGKGIEGKPQAVNRAIIAEVLNMSFSREPFEGRVSQGGSVR